jgi:DNA polymerase-3 subunit delta
VPALDIAALRKQINAGKLAPVYLFVGEDVRLSEQMLDAIEATVDEADRPFAVERVYAGEASGSPVAIAAAARVYPMLGDRRIVFVLRAERLLKPKRAARPGDIEPPEGAVPPDEPGVDFTPLEEYLTAPSPSTSLVFVATEIDRTRRFTKRLVERGQVVVFGGFGNDGPPGRQDPRTEAMRFVNHELAGAGRTIDAAALSMLVDRTGDDITRLRGDLERLLLYTQGQSRISQDDVLEVVSSETQVQDDWGVVNAITDGDAARALVEVGARLDRGDSPHMLVGQLRWWVSSKLAEADPERVRPAIDALFRTDLALKSSGGDERVLIERLIVELAGKRLMRRW